jgi:phage repressor protein C with HTH and peptisase S24 domain/DNA-binding XRE family transcriptional regulator
MNIKELRERVNLTQEELSLETHIPRERIAKWESGNIQPKTLDYNTLNIFFQNREKKIRDLYNICINDAKDILLTLKSEVPWVGTPPSENKKFIEVKFFVDSEKFENWMLLCNELFSIIKIKKTPKINNSTTSVRTVCDFIRAIPNYKKFAWLLTDESEMLKETVSNEMTKIHKPIKYMEKIIESQDVTLYDISTAANLKTLFVQKEQNILGKITLPNIPKCDGAMYVTGDSMDPIIKSGDIICYKEIQDFNNIIYGEMYIVSIDMEGDEYLSVKYITRSDKGDAWVRLESYNKRHSPKDFELKYVNALALVKISIRMNTMG